MSPMSSVNTEMVELLQAVQKHYSANEYDAVISKVNQLLETVPMAEEQRDAFRYYLAAALDSSGKPFEALPIFVGLAERDPGCIFKATSVKITCRNICQQAHDLYRRRPDAKELERFEEVLLGLGEAPFWLRMHLVKRRARAGEGKAARVICEAHLQLSPNDSDYLSHSVEVARILQDREWLSKLENHLSTLCEKYPFRMDLVELLEQFEKGSAIA